MNAKLIISILIAVIIVCLSCSDNNTDPFANAIWFGNEFILGLEPKNNSDEIKSIQEFQIEFSDSVLPGSGSIRLYQYSNQKLIQRLNVKTDVSYDGNIAKFQFTSTFGINTRYFILIDKGAFKMSMNRIYEGLKDTTYWNFISESIKNKNNEFYAKIIKADGDFDYNTPLIGYIEDFFEKGQSIIQAAILDGFNSCNYNILLSFPTDIKGGTDYQMSPSKNFSIFNMEIYQYPREYHLENGTMQIIHNDSVYIEGHFNFTAKTDSNQTMEARDGYFFVKK